MSRYVIGVDVGTTSARAGVFNGAGEMLASSANPIETWKPRPGFVEQSSDDIWRAICAAVRSAVGAAGISTAEVAGISFDATCSLVALDSSCAPLTVDVEGDPGRNVI